jgi:hypothetical protein
MVLTGVAPVNILGGLYHSSVQNQMGFLERYFVRVLVDRIVGVGDRQSSSGEVDVAGGGLLTRLT